jgi:hypothetical protein
MTEHAMTTEERKTLRWCINAAVWLGDPAHSGDLDALRRLERVIEIKSDLEKALQARIGASADKMIIFGERNFYVGK